MFLHHLSQILSYVMNQEDRSKPHTMNACGALVYPTVDEDFDFSYRYKETGHRIFVRTVNLGQPWRKNRGTGEGDCEGRRQG